MFWGVCGGRGGLENCVLKMEELVNRECGEDSSAIIGDQHMCAMYV